MQYISTRGGMAPATFSDVLIEGLAPDGGLTIPDSLPHYSLSDLEKLSKLSYNDTTFELLQRFASDIPPADLEGIIKKTYTKEVFGTEEITPAAAIMDDLFILELSNGPTLAFKDVALQLLGNLFEYALEKRKDFLNIVGASSGDTFTAAIYATMGKKNVNIFMLTPFGRMSTFQTAQGYSILSPNVFNIAVDGDFDLCQDIAKAISEDAVFKKEYHIGAVNSYNWARVAAQVVYYFKAYFAAVKKVGQKVDFAVPTGNFGDILAGYIARKMGLPINKSVLATNENNVLDEFFKTGVYRKREKSEVLQTNSQSMDIAVASNFERFLYDAIGNPQALKSYMDNFKKTGLIDLRGTEILKKAQNAGIVSGCSLHDQRIMAIRHIYNMSGRIICPHTAAGVAVGMQYKEEGIPMIFLETARYLKFEDSVAEAGIKVPERPEKWKGLEQREQKYERMPSDIGAIKSYIAQNALRAA